MLCIIRQHKFEFQIFLRGTQLPRLTNAEEYLIPRKETIEWSQDLMPVCREYQKNELVLYLLMTADRYGRKIVSFFGVEKN